MIFISKPPLINFVLVIITFFTFSILTAEALAQNQSAVLPEASWQAEIVHWPGVITFGGKVHHVPSAQVDILNISVNEFADEITIYSTPPLILKKVCKDDVVLANVPSADFGDLKTRDLTVWLQEGWLDEAYRETVLFEQPGGVFVGTHKAETSHASVKIKLVISPMSPLPQLPVEKEKPKLSPIAQSVKHAIAKKLATQFRMNSEDVEDYIAILSFGNETTQAGIWLDQNGVALRADRDLKDPCNQRYGNIKAAHKLYIFKTMLAGDGTYYVVTQLKDVETGRIIAQYNRPSVLDQTADIQTEVNQTYDSFGVEIRKPSIE